ncbi:MAG: hypothetical protein JXA16_04840 [Bacteroidales bacterium]|nr:hypothetical protein [Bacteroidales bacterium]
MTVKKFTLLYLFIVFSSSISNAQIIPSTNKITLDNIKKEYPIKSIKIIGNDKTKKIIILRELSFKENQLIDSLSLQKKIDESKINLLKLPLFNYVYFNVLKSEDYSFSIIIVVEERWYLWPEIKIINNDRNFNIWWQEKNLEKLDYRIAIKKYNALGLNHIVRAEVSFGYTKELILEYKNLFLDKFQKHFIDYKVSYFKQKQVFFQTYENKLQAYTSDSEKAIYGFNNKLTYTYRPEFYKKHQISLSFDKISIQDSLLLLNNNFLGENVNEKKFFSLTYRYLFDKRNDRSYPTEGSWFSFEINEKGLFPNMSNNMHLLNFISTYKIFYKLNNKFFAANSLSIKNSFDGEQQPYYFQQALGYKYYLRGFEYYVIDGQDFYLIKNTLKFQPFPKKISYINFIPFKKFNKIHYTFYLNLFFELGYVNNKYVNNELLNTLSNKMLYSSGIGFDISTYYDKVIRFEYSINQFKESGFFIHFIAPI